MVDPKLREAAEREMGRLAPESREDGGGKRRKTGKAGPKGEEEEEEEEGAEAAAVGPRSHQYEYQAAGPLLRGASGFLISCSFKRERSAIGEMAAYCKTTSAPPCRQAWHRRVQRVRPAAARRRARRAAGGCGLSSSRPGGWSSCGCTRRTTAARPSPACPPPRWHSWWATSRAGGTRTFASATGVMPIERSCPFDLASLQATASECAERHLKSHGGSEPPADGSPGQLPGVTYAVRFNIRGSDKAAKAQADGGGAEPRLDRAVVTKALAEAFAASCDGLLAPAVDLSAPQVVVFGESVGLASGEHLAMLCVVDSALVTLKPRMCMRSIFAGGNA
eukprot:jgi/Tetstr1/423250/TSEL_013950.t1